jgi:hypothetical protein
MKRTFKLLCSIISLAIVFTCLPLESIADEISDSLKCRSLSEASYTVSENVITTWPGHANIEIVFTNTGDAPICNWNYTFEFVYNIENPYNCTVLEHEGDLYTVGNNGWNKDIGPGESVTIGFTASSNDGSDIEYMPSFYLLNNANNILPEGSVTVDYVEYSDWTSGSSGALILTNNTDSSIGDWTITFSANRPITDAYDVSFSVNDDGTYTISGSSYSDISAGGTYQIGIQCGEHDSTIPFEINNLIVSSSTLAINMNEDTNNNDVPDVSEIDYNGFITTPTPTVTDIPTVTEEPTPTTTDVPTDTPEPTPTGIILNPDDDLDGDGLTNYAEEIIGTDPNNQDSDGDGLSDGDEIWMFYNPTMQDTDLNGILDGDEDYDMDGLSNLQEIVNGTCPWAEDSDFDGINDYEELFVFGTDPNNEDTDGDSILDGDEIALGLDPTSVSTNGTLDIEKTNSFVFEAVDKQLSGFNTDDQPFEFSFDISASGLVDKYIKVIETGYKYAIEDNSTILGKSPEIIYNDQYAIESVTVRFTMKDGYNSSIDKYCVFYYWEGYNLLIPIETEYDYDTGTVYATNSMIGTYCLVDTDQMYELLEFKEEEQGEKSLAKPSLKNEVEESELNSDSTYSLGEKITYNGHVYFLITSDTPMLYNEAVAVCAQFGGYPAVITSAEENSFIASISNAAWIGGSVRFHGISTPTVDWITGEDCTYTYWGFGSYNANDFPKWEGFPITTAGVWGWNWRDPETYTEARVICEKPIVTIPDEGEITISTLTFGKEDYKLNCFSDSDVDGDGILDYQELSAYDLGSFDISTGVYKPATLSEYYDMAALNGIFVNNSVADKIGSTPVSSFSSDINDPNKDKDDVSDSEDGNPLYNVEYWTLSLGGDLYDINYPKQDGYILVEKTDEEKTITYYGGDQRWFYWTAYGCGQIATHDVISYINNGSNYTYDYYDYIVETNDFNKQLGSKCRLAVIAMNDYGLAYSWGPVAPYGVCNILNEYIINEYNAYSLIDTENNRNDILYLIVDSLLNDRPVILFGTSMELYYWNSELNKWDKQTSTLKEGRWHYVTITGILVIQGSLYLKVQTWGMVAYLKYDEIFGPLNTIYC